VTDRRLPPPPPDMPRIVLQLPDRGAPWAWGVEYPADQRAVVLEHERAVQLATAGRGVVVPLYR
jgi:hypothetical protein